VHRAAGGCCCVWAGLGWCLGGSSGRWLVLFWGALGLLLARCWLWCSVWGWAGGRVWGGLVVLLAAGWGCRGAGLAVWGVGWVWGLLRCGARWRGWAGLVLGCAAWGLGLLLLAGGCWRVPGWAAWVCGCAGCAGLDLGCVLLGLGGSGWLRWGCCCAGWDLRRAGGGLGLDGAGVSAGCLLLAAAWGAVRAAWAGWLVGLLVAAGLLLLGWAAGAGVLSVLGCLCWASGAVAALGAGPGGGGVCCGGLLLLAGWSVLLAGAWGCWWVWVWACWGAFRGCGLVLGGDGVLGGGLVCCWLLWALVFCWGGLNLGWSLVDLLLG